MQSSQALYQEQKQEVINLFGSYIQIAQSQNLLDVVKRLKEMRQRFIDSQLLVVVCGEFKEGKSSLMNALLNEIKADLFPVDVDIATGIVTTICYGEQEKITLTLGDTGKEEHKEITREDIAQYASEKYNKGNNKKVKRLIIESPNSQLKEGLVLVDTPGVGGLNSEHTSITYAYIPEADSVLFVSDVIRPLTTEELKFLSYITERCPHVIDNTIFVATKKDFNSNYKEILEGNRQKLSYALQLPKEKISIIPVSSHNKFSYLRNGDVEDLEDSNFLELENALWQLLRQNSGYIVLMRALDELRTASEEIKIPIQTALSACQKEREQEIAQLEEKIRSEQQRLQELQSNNAAWLNQLRRGVNGINTKILISLQKGFVKIESYVNSSLLDDEVLKNPTQLASSLEAEVTTLMSLLKRELNQEADNLYQNIKSTSNLELSFSNVGTIQWQPIKFSVDGIKVRETGGGEKAFNILRSVSIGGGVGAAVGSFFGPIGSVLGGIWGAVTAVRQNLTQAQTQDLSQIRNQLSSLARNYLAESRILSDEAVKKAITDIDDYMEMELRSQIQRLEQTCKRSLNSIKESRQLTESEKAAKIKDLTLPLQTVSQLYRQVERLATIVIQAKDAATRSTSMNENNETQSTKGEDWADG